MNEDGYGVWKTYGKTSMIRGKVKISIHLDLLKNEVTFSVNEEDWGVAYKNVKVAKNVDYRLMVSLMDKNHNAEILNFSKLG